MSKVIYILLGLVLFGLTLLSFHYLFLNYYPYELVDIKSIEIANGGEYQRGDEITFIVTYHKKTNYPSETFRRIECEDGNLVTMTSFSTSLPLTDGEYEKAISPPMVIPNKVSSGYCWFVFTEHTEVNDVRTIVWETRSEPFKVVE